MPRYHEVESQLVASRTALTVLSLVIVAVALAPAGAAVANDWAASWSQGGFEDEGGTHIAMDSQGNVYVAGYAFITGRGDYDMVVIKYNSQGVQQWDYTYDGGLHNALGYDEPAGIGVDDLGNVYVSGRSRHQRSDSQDYDYLTLKLSAAGVEQWTVSYDYLGGSYPHGDDKPAGFAVDGAGNTWVTGESDADYLTVKYSSDGVEQWTSRYTGEQQGTVGRATALTIDAAGNAYVTGRYMDADAHYDYVTIRYSASGAQDWKARYGSDSVNSFEPFDIVLTSDGNVAVTGQGASDPDLLQWDILTVSHDCSTGGFNWAQTYDGSADVTGSADRGTGIAADHLGNVFVGGYAEMTGSDKDFVTIKYSSAGDEEWVRTYNEMDDTGDTYDTAHDIGVDGYGNVYLTGGLYVDHFGFARDRLYAVVKYDSAGTLQWVEYHDRTPEMGFTGYNQAEAIAVNPSGALAVTGYFWGVTTFPDIDTMAIDGDPAPAFSDGFETGDCSRWSTVLGG